ncbi:binding-protein-dependent transport systems inner membrane component [Ahrensia sp. R2A130]|nr:binding-protein-dependent transport systems inner membrane component [Ahrensia sp. R2A130]
MFPSQMLKQHFTIANSPQTRPTIKLSYKSRYVALPDIVATCPANGRLSDHFRKALNAIGLAKDVAPPAKADGASNLFYVTLDDA